MIAKSKLAMTAICIATSLAPHFAHATATRLTSYSSLIHALKNGHRVIAVGDNKNCTVKEYDNPIQQPDGLPDPDLEMTIGIGFTTNFFLTYRDHGDKRYHVLAVATNMGSLADHTPVQRIKQIKIYDDNTSLIYAAASDYQTGKVKAHIITSCGISNGDDQNGLSIFDYDAVK